MKTHVLADTTLFSEQKEPVRAVEEGEDVKQVLVRVVTKTLRRSQSVEGIRLILAFSGHVCKWHPEQLTLAEYCAFAARDVIAHLELAAEAKVKQAPKKDAQTVESDEGTDDEAARTTRRQELEIVDIGGGTREDVEEDEADLEITECSLFP